MGVDIELVRKDYALDHVLAAVAESSPGGRRCPGSAPGSPHPTSTGTSASSACGTSGPCWPDRETGPFRRVRRRDVPLVEDVLVEIEAEHRAAHLEFQADRAVQLVAWLHVSTRTFDRFVPTAERLGSEWWMPVTAMAETAVEAGRTELEVQVFAAATSREGMHRDFLAQKCFVLTGRSLEPGPHLRLVK